MSLETDLHFLTWAYKVAADRSVDPSTQNAAVLIGKDGKFISQECNHFPDGLDETPERWERPLKYSYVEHAERNAIFEAAYWGKATAGATMYACWAACPECARAIIGAGIERVVSHKKTHDASPEHWKGPVKIGLDMLDEAGVVHDLIDADLGVKIRFNGEVTEF